MYNIKEVTVSNERVAGERKVLVIEFDDPKQAIVGEFLMTDALLMDFAVLNDLEKVLTGEVKVETVSGNRCNLEISKERVIISDLFEDLFTGIDTYPAYEIETVKLRDLIIMWRNEVDR